MELDFSKLNTIASQTISPKDYKLNLPEDSFDTEDAPADNSRENIGLSKEKELYQNMLKAYQEYEENKSHSMLLKGDIVKGLNDGEDLEELFLKAIKAIGCMTGERSYYDIVEKKLNEKY